MKLSKTLPSQNFVYDKKLYPQLVEKESSEEDMLREPSTPEILGYRRQDAEFLVHGLVENYPQGYHEQLLCPHCD